MYPVSSPVLTKAWTLRLHIVPSASVDEVLAPVAVRIHKQTKPSEKMSAFLAWEDVHSFRGSSTSGAFQPRLKGRQIPVSIPRVE
jgi:hypothetical protein